MFGIKLGLNRSTGSVAEVPPNLINQVGGTVYGAYSVARKINGNYSGAAIRVENSIGDQEDIGFDAFGDLDEAALTTFAGAEFVIKIRVLYDQSGNGRDLTQTVFAIQPIIYDSGTIKNNFRPSMLSEFGAHLVSTHADTINAEDFHVSMVVNFTNIAGTSYITAGENTINSAVWSFGEVTPVITSYFYFTGNFTSAELSLGTTYFCSYRVSNASGEDVYINNFQDTSGGPSGTYFNNLAIGADPSGNNAANAYIQEVVIYAPLTETQRETMNNDTNAYYTIF